MLRKDNKNGNSQDLLWDGEFPEGRSYALWFWLFQSISTESRTLNGSVPNMSIFHIMI